MDTLALVAIAASFGGIVSAIGAVIWEWMQRKRLKSTVSVPLEGALLRFLEQRSQTQLTSLADKEKIASMLLPIMLEVTPKKALQQKLKTQLSPKEKQEMLEILTRSVKKSATSPEKTT